MITSDSEDELFEMSKAREGTQLIAKKNGNVPQDIGNNKSQHLNNSSSSRYPMSVFFIISNEFCERFSYYGMRTILTIYLTQRLKFDGDTGTAIYHSFVGLCYIAPLFGAMIADGFIGKYRTILYVSIVYAIGNIVMALTAIPPPEMVGPAFGLILIGLGTGGIKPCVVAFGGDQFTADQEQMRAGFFSVFYFAINAGSLLSTFLTPVLRGDVQCFGGDCYFIAFGVPAILMIISLMLFLAGRKTYKKNPPTGNIIAKTFKCIMHALKNKMRMSLENRDHWLDYANDLYEESFISDVRAALRVLLMFLPLPLFWALFDQQGSRWTLQAAKLDGELGTAYRIKPEQLQAINPVFILVLIPIFEKGIYPLLDKLHIPNSPLQRMVAGMVLAVVSFIIAGFLQIKIDATMEVPLNAGQSEVKILNAAPCPVSVNGTFGQYNISQQQGSKEFTLPSSTYLMKVQGTCKGVHLSASDNVTFDNLQAYNVLVGYSNSQLNLYKFEDHHTKPKKGKAMISIIYAVPNEDRAIVTIGGNRLNMSEFNSSKFLLLEPNIYTITLADQYNMSIINLKTLRLHNGGVYTVVIQLVQDKAEAVVYEDVKPNTLSIFLQVPQYIVITMGEVMFSITGLSFAYSQAPPTMKSVMQAGWLLTVAGGNLMVVLVAETKLLRQSAEFFLFSGLMGGVTLIFAVMGYFYKYVNFNGGSDSGFELDTTGLVTDKDTTDVINDEDISIKQK